jgi:hypothetical protein
MSEKTKDLTKLSRRSLLQGAACAACAVPILLVTSEAALAAKVSQASVHYKNSPNGDKKCSTCKQFVAPSTCKSVQGTISPNGYCNIWTKK